MIIASLSLFGVLSYTQWLTREGFPPIAFPIAVVNVSYQADSEALDSEIVEPIVKALGEEENVIAVNSRANDNFAVLSVQFSEATNSTDAAAEVKEKIQSLGLNENAVIEVNEINPSSVDGQNDFVFSVGREGYSSAELTEVARNVAAVVTNLASVNSAEAQELSRELVNPITGETQEFQVSFNRIGYSENGEINFIPAVDIGIKKKSGVSAIELSEAVRNSVADLQEAGGILEGFEVSYKADIATTLDQQTSSLESNAFTAILTIFIVLVLFINWRSALISAISIPLVMLTVFLVFLIGGITLNVISLFALILVLGLIVDDSIVVVEAIDAARKEGKYGLSGVKHALDKVAIADVSGTLTTLLVFVPMLAISGILGEFIVQIPITVIIALVVSLLISLTILPFLTRMLLPGKGNKKEFILTRISDFVNDKLSGFFAGFIRLYLNKWYFTLVAIILSGIVIITGFGSAANLAFNIFPAPKDVNELNISVLSPEGASVSDVEEYIAEIETGLSNSEYRSEIKAIDLFSGNSRGATIMINLTNLNEREAKASEIVSSIEQNLPEKEGYTTKVSFVSTGPPVGDFPFQMQVYLDDQTELERVTEVVAGFLRNRSIDVSTAEASNFIKVNEIKIENLETIARRDGERYAVVSVSFDREVTSGEILAVQQNIENEFNQTRRTELGIADNTIRFDQGIESDNLESFNSAIIAFMFALVAMYVLLVIQFNSFTQPLLVFLALPFSAWGVFPGLSLTENSLSFFVMIGAIALSGVAVNNTIMLLDYANQERVAGKSLKEAIVIAISRRFRPIVTTTVTTVAGLLPLALFEPFWESLSVTIISGLVASTIMVILFFPAYYVLIENIRYVVKWPVKKLFGIS